VVTCLFGAGHVVALALFRYKRGLWPVGVRPRTLWYLVSFGAGPVWRALAPFVKRGDPPLNPSGNNWWLEDHPW